jgi:sortase A
VRRVIGGLGRAFVTAGVLILLFVTYQLWGTGLYTSREQDRLRDELTSQIERDDTPSTSTTSTSAGADDPTITTTTAPSTTTTTTDQSEPAIVPVVPAEGQPLAIIRIPRISIDKIVVQGVSRDDLRKGPGHYPDSPLPGQEGNVAIAGHRTTYGAPFGNLDQLENGDRIFVNTRFGEFTYEVFRADLIVQPTDVSVLEVDAARPAILTLTTCNPKYSAAQRLVVQAELVEEPLPVTSGGQKAKVTKDGLSGESSSKTPTAIAGLVVALIGALWWLLFHRHPSLPNWLLGAVPFAVALFVFYALLERVLPSNY